MVLIPCEGQGPDMSPRTVESVILSLDNVWVEKKLNKLEKLPYQLYANFYSDADIFASQLSIYVEA